MTGLRPALLAMLAWAVHFFVAYGLMLALPDAPIVAWLTIALGAACLAFVAALFLAGPRNTTVAAATLLAAAGIVWQSLVGLF